MPLEGGVSFENTGFEGDVSFDECVFDRPVLLRKVKIEQNVILDDSVFNGLVLFEEAQIAGNLEASRVEFRAIPEKWIDKTASFRGTECQGRATFHVRVCSGQLSFAFATFGQFIFTTADSALITGGGSVISGTAGSPIPEISLSGATVHRLVRISKVSTPSLLAGSLRVEGPTYLSDVQLTGKADFSGSKFTVLSLREVSWPNDPGSFDILRMTYDLVVAGEEKETNELLLNLADRASTMRVFTRTYPVTLLVKAIRLKQIGRLLRESIVNEVGCPAGEQLGSATYCSTCLLGTDAILPGPVIFVHSLWH